MWRLLPLFQQSQLLHPVVLDVRNPWLCQPPLAEVLQLVHCVLPDHRHDMVSFNPYFCMPRSVFNGNGLWQLFFFHWATSSNLPFNVASVVLVDVNSAPYTIVFPLHHLITEFTGLLGAYHHRNGCNLRSKAIRKDPAPILTFEVLPGLVQ